MKCETCRWFDADSTRAEATRAGDGVCRRFPPPAPAVYEDGPACWDFPEVDATDWCGEYAPPAGGTVLGRPVLRRAEQQAGRTELTAHQARGVIETTLRQHQERRDFRGESEGCRCGARGPYLGHLAGEVAVALGYPA